MRNSLLLILITLLFLSGCDELRPAPIESNLEHLSVEALVQKLDQALHRLDYHQGNVGANLGRVGMRMELRTVQSCLEQLGLFDGPRLGILDDKTVDAINHYLENRKTLLQESHTP